jgi:hypothetical protein
MKKLFCARARSPPKNEGKTRENEGKRGKFEELI